MKRVYLLGVIITVILVIGVIAYYYSTILMVPGDPIVIGAALPLTGVLGSTGKQVQIGYETWLEAVNEKGGISGRPVQMIIYDDQSDPTSTKSLYQKLVSVDNVDLLLGPYAASEALAAAPIAEQNNMVMINPITASKALYESDYEWQFKTTTGGGELVCQPLFDLFDTLPSDAKPHTIAIAVAASEGFLPIAEEARNIAGNRSYEVVYYEVFPMTTADATGIISNAKAKNPDVFIGLGYVQHDQLLLTTAYELGFKPKVLFFQTSSVYSFITDLGEEVMNGVTHNVPFDYRLNYVGVEEFANRVENKYGVSGKEIDSGAATAYASCQLIEAAIKGTGGVNNTSIRNWLLSNTVDTVIGPWKVDQNAVARGVRYIPELRTTISQWLNGYREVVYPQELATESFLYPIP